MKKLMLFQRIIQQIQLLAFIFFLCSSRAHALDPIVNVYKRIAANLNAKSNQLIGSLETLPQLKRNEMLDRAAQWDFVSEVAQIAALATADARSFEIIQANYQLEYATFPYLKQSSTLSISIPDERSDLEIEILELAIIIEIEKWLQILNQNKTLLDSVISINDEEDWAKFWGPRIEDLFMPIVASILEVGIEHYLTQKVVLDSSIDDYDVTQTLANPTEKRNIGENL